MRPRLWISLVLSLAGLSLFAAVVPEVAKTVPKVSRDEKTQTIELRHTYRFHTGARITAANFVAALNRAANPRLDSSATVYMHEIVGADATAGRPDVSSDALLPDPDRDATRGDRSPP